MGYGKGVSVGLVMEELIRGMMEDVRRKRGNVRR